MISMRYFLAIYFIFLGYQGLSYALTCYRCTGCGTTSNTWSTTVSTTVNDSCFKDDISVSVVSTVDRGARSGCTEGTSGSTTTSCCSTNLCNGSVSFRNSFILSFLFGIALVLFRIVRFY